jgi:hypothetical protein
MAVCQTVTVESATPDESTVEILTVSPSSPRPGVIVVAVEVRNRIVSGDGETLSPTLAISLNGGSDNTVPVESLSPGSQTAVSVELTNTPTGEVEVCAGVR